MARLSLPCSFSRSLLRCSGTLALQKSYGHPLSAYSTDNAFADANVIFKLVNSLMGKDKNELAGELVFGGLLGFPKTSVLAMFVFSHPLAALIMTIMCVVCLSSLGISLTGAMKMNVPKDDES
jgi:hypothetical protein